MKKIVIAMLLILPLLIVMCVLLSASIISNTAYIAVEGISLNVPTDETVELSLSERAFQLKAVVLPTGATNKNVLWTVENLQIFGDEVKYPNPVAVDKTGFVTFDTYCTFDIVATTVEGSKTARVNFYIKGDKLEKVEIKSERDSIMTGEALALSAVCSPLDANVEDIEWTSSDPTVLYVDNNGIIKGKSVGQAEVKVKITDTVYATKTITVTKGATAYGNKFTVGSDVLSLRELGIEGVVNVLSGASIDKDVLTLTGQKAELSVNGQGVEITKCEPDSVSIENYEHLNKRLLRVGKLPIYLKGVYTDVTRTDEPNLRFISSDTAKATVNNDGKVVARKKGNVNISLVGSDVAITFDVVVPVNFIRLKDVDGNDKRGISAENVYGNYDYVDGKYVGHTYKVDIQYPNDIDWEDFEITVDKPEKATLEGNVLTLSDKITNKECISIVVKAKYSAYESMEVQTVRRLWVVKGVNCTDYQTVKKVNEDKFNIVMRQNITLSANDTTLELVNNFYGNGYMLDGTLMTKGKNGETALVLISASNVSVLNAHLRMDDAAKINTKEGLRGSVLQVAKLKQATRLDNITVKHTVIESGFYLVSTYNCEKLRLDGCILRNASNFGVYLPTDNNDDYQLDESDPYYQYTGISWTNMEMNNCVISNVVATAIGLSCNTNSASSRKGENQSKFVSTGFLDIYNWQDLNNARMIDRDIIEGNEATNKIIQDALKTMLSQEVQRSEYDNIRYTISENNRVTHYIMLGAVSAGALYYSTDEITIEDKKMVRFPLKRVDDLLGQFKFSPCTLYVYDNSSEITPKSDFSEDARLYSRLRGE